jgi:hypothetical protein
VPNPAANKYASTGLYIKAAPGLKLRDRRVTRLAVKVRAVLPWLQPSDGPVVRAWCEMEYLCNQVYAALRAYGVTNPRGEVRRLLEDYRKMRSVQLKYSRELGMGPESRQKLKASGDSMAFDLAEPATTRAVEISESRNMPSPTGLCAHGGCNAPTWATGGPVPLCREHAKALAANGEETASDAAAGTGVPSNGIVEEVDADGKADDT